MEKKNGDDSSPVVKLSDCLEELLNFTLNYHSNLLNLQTQFCSTLLKQQENDSFSYFDSLEGVPPYPLYKRLASALLKCIDSQILKSVSFELHVQEPFFTQLK
ncbi:hypothetical protein L195_g016663, partial [Trifolium pratense]